MAARHAPLREQLLGYLAWRSPRAARWRVTLSPSRRRRQPALAALCCCDDDPRGRGRLPLHAAQLKRLATSEALVGLTPALRRRLAPRGRCAQSNDVVQVG